MIHLKYFPVKTNVYSLLKVIVKTKILAIPYGIYKKKKNRFLYSLIILRFFFCHFGHVKFYSLVRHLIVSLTVMEKSYPD